MYKIKIEYETGDSFHREDTFTYLDHEFKDIKVAEENLLRIKNHYEFHKEHDDWKKPKGKLPLGVVWNDEYRSILLETIDDEGNIFTELPDWASYFGTMYGAYIELVNEKYQYTPGY